MDYRKTAIERAFELAKSGDVPNLMHLKAQIGREGYSVSHLAGPSLTRQLKGLLAESLARQSSDG